MEAANLTLRINTEGMDEAQGGLQTLGDTAEYVQKMVTRMVEAWASWEIAKQIRDVTTLAARYDTLGVVMGTIGNNAGYTGQQMKDFQSALEKTGISMLAARQSLTMMAAAQLDLTKAAQLGRVAQDAAVIGNVNSSEAFETLTRSITTGMAIEAHRLGIMVNYRKAEHDYAASIGKTTQELTNQEKEHARLIEVLDQGAKRQGAYTSAMETAGKQALSMERFVENLEVVLGQTFQPAYTVIIHDMTAALQGAREWVDKNKDSVDLLGDSLKSVTIQGAQFTRMLADLGGGSSGASGSVGFLGRTFQGVSFLIAGATDIIRGTVGTLAQYLGGAIEEIGKDLDKITKFFHLPGSGGVKNFGAGISSWGNGIMAPLQTGDSALTAWYDSVLGGQMASSHAGANSTTEAQRIAAAAAAAEAERQRQAAEAAALATQKLATAQAKFKDQLTQTLARHMTEGTVVTAWEREQIDLMTKKLGLQKASFDLADAMVKLSTKDKIVPTDLLSGPKKVGDTLSFTPVQSSTESALKAMQAASKAGEAWAIIGQTVVETSSYASDAVTRWMDNLDGLGRSWTTLGDTVRNVLADMIRQMERAIIQQKLMEPLFEKLGLSSGNWIQHLFGNGGGGTTGTSTGTYFGNGSSLPGGAGGFTGVVPGMPPVTNQITVHVADGSAAVKANPGKGGEDIAKSLQGAMNQWAVDNMRPGGLLAQGAR